MAASIGNDNWAKGDVFSRQGLSEMWHNEEIQKVRHIAIPVILCAGAVWTTAIATSPILFLVGLATGVVASALKNHNLVIYFQTDGFGLQLQEKEEKKAPVQDKKAQEGVCEEEVKAQIESEGRNLLQQLKEKWNDPRLQKVKRIAVAILAVAATIAIGATVGSYVFSLFAGASLGVFVTAAINRSIEVQTISDEGFQITC